MASWIQQRLKAAEDLLEAVDRTAKTVSVPRKGSDGSIKSSSDSQRVSVEAFRVVLHHSLRHAPTGNVAQYLLS